MIIATATPATTKRLGRLPLDATSDNRGVRCCGRTVSNLGVDAKQRRKLEAETRRPVIQVHLWARRRIVVNEVWDR